MKQSDSINHIWYKIFERVKIFLYPITYGTPKRYLGIIFLELISSRTNDYM